MTFCRRFTPGSAWFLLSEGSWGWWGSGRLGSQPVVLETSDGKWGEPGKENDEVSPNEESSGVRSSQKPCPGLWEEESVQGEEGLDPKERLPIWLLARGSQKISRKKHYLERKNPSWRSSASFCGREVLRHPISSWLALLNPHIVALYGYYQCFTCVKTDSGRLGNLPNFKHPGAQPHPDCKATLLATPSYRIASERLGDREGPLQCAQTQPGGPGQHTRLTSPQAPEVRTCSQNIWVSSCINFKTNTFP